MSGWRIGSALLAAATMSAAGCSAVRYSADFDREAPFREYKTYAWSPASPQERAALQRVNPFLEKRLRRAIDRELASRGFVQAPEDEADFLVSAHPLVPERTRGDSASANAYRRSGPRVSMGVGIGFGRRYGYGYPYFGYRNPYLFYYPYWGFGYYPFGGLGYYPFGAFGYPYDFDYPYAFYPAWGRYPPSGLYPMGAYGRRYRRGLAQGTLVVDVIDTSNQELVWRGSAEGALLETPREAKLDEYVARVVEKILKRFPPPSEDR